MLTCSRNLSIKGSGESRTLSSESLEQGLVNDSLQYSPWPVFKNKVLFEHNHIHLFMSCLWLLSHYNSRVEQLQKRLYGLQSLNYLLFGP